MNLQPLCLILILLLSLARTVSAQESPWESDIEKALERAKAERKGILIALPGPSTTPHCKKVNAKVLADPNFAAAFDKNFVLFKILPPEDAERDEAGKAAYRKFLSDFKISIYPIFLLTDQEGRVFATAPMDDPDLDANITALRDLSKNAILLKEALSLKDAAGDPKAIAKRISTLLDSLTEPIAFRYHRDLIDRVIELDSTNELGLKELWEDRTYSMVVVRRFDEIYLSISRELKQKKTAAEAIALMDETIKKQKMDAKLQQLMEFQKFRAWATEGNHAKMLESLKRSRDLAPDTPYAGRVVSLIERMEKMVQAKKEKEQAEQKDGSAEAPVNPGQSGEAGTSPSAEETAPKENSGAPAKPSEPAEKTPAETPKAPEGN